MRLLWKFSCMLALAGCATPVVQDDNFSKALREVRDHPMSAEAHAALAEAHHWRKDFASAEVEYRRAAELDPRYLWAIAPLLDEEKKWDDIISLAGHLQWTVFPASILGPLATAYHEKGRPVQAGLIIEHLEQRTHISDREDDYRHYVLAYAYLWSDALEKAVENLRLIKSPEMLRYARTSWKFEKLFQNESFLRLTSSEGRE